MNMNQKSVDVLLNMVSKKVGSSPEELKSNLQKGDLSQVTRGLNPEDSKKLMNVLSDKNLTEKIMSSPEAQELMKKFSGQK